MSNTNKIKPLADKVSDELYQYIISNKIAIGTKLPNEYVLAQDFGVGRSTIREAIKILVSKNILEIKRGDGTYVISNISTEDDPLNLSKIEDKFNLALDLVNARIIIEPEIAVLAVEHATEEDIFTLTKLCDEVERKIVNGEDYILDDIAFHSYIAKCSKNAVMEQLVPIIHSSVSTFVNITHKQLMTETISTHRAVLNAIIDRDRVGAKGAMLMHMMFNRELIIKLSKENNE